MGTRADFYVGRGASAQWIGSLALDGYPSAMRDCGVIGALTESEYRATVERLLDSDISATRPDQGWPWPWANSTLTDYAYAWDTGSIHASCFGGPWFDPRVDDEDDRDSDDKQIFPDMSRCANIVLHGPRSGLMKVVLLSAAEIERLAETGDLP